jgi:hypothetical protein
MSRWSADSRAYRRQRLAFLLANPVCWLCGHPAADQIDHAIPVGPPHHGSRFDPGNWRPAHGVAGCPSCGQRCNQVRGARLDRPAPIRSRRW